MIISRKNLHQTQKIQKQAYNNAMKLKNYGFNNKVLFNSKYIKTK